MRQDTDVLVIGSGAAGLYAALTAADHARVTLVTKTTLQSSNSSWAQGGVAAVTAPDDTVADHVADTLNAGAGLCDERVAELCVREGPDRMAELTAWGVPFDRDETGAPSLGLEGGHRKRRVLHVRDTTGAAITATLIERARSHPNITLCENTPAVDLLLRHKLDAATDARPRKGGPLDCVGAYLLDRATGEVRAVTAPATILATGGCGKVYLYTSNPDVATGDGVAMAHRAGARVANMEFYQFHPTCLFHPQAKSFLISEALRGEGGVLVRRDGTRFMADYHEMADLAPRDVVARAIDTELKRTGDDCVYLDITHRSAAYLNDRFPLIAHECARWGIDIATMPIPVVPAAHYACGGVMTDTEARTNVHGLLVAGEAAYTGLHGANRLASNSLLEALVFGRRAAAGAVALKDRFVHDPPSRVPAWDHGQAVRNDEGVVISQTWDEIRRFMWNYVGIVRSNHRLQRALARILQVKQEIRSDYWKYRISADMVELRNLAGVAELIVLAAIARKESRGLHFNENYPERDDERFGRPTVL